METATLLNIKPAEPRGSKTMTEQTLAMVSSDKPSASKDRADSFKSALKDQIDKESNAARSDKSLPQNGNDLPKKEMATDTHEKQTTANSAETNEQPRNDEQENNADSEKNHELNKQQGTGTSSSENEQTETETETQDVEKNINQETEAVNKLLQEELSVTDNDESEAAQPIHSEYPVFPVASDGLIPDKKIYSESTNSQLSSSQASKVVKPEIQAVSGNFSSASDANSNSNFNSKNESALGKSVAEFQQYIEMSRKHSTAGEPISSVKSFEQNLKNGLAAALSPGNDMKLSANQNLNQNTALPQVTSTTVAQVIPLDKVNTSLNNASFSISKTTMSLGVKTPVGKSGWNQNFSNQISMMVNNGVQHAKIKLNPMSLGPVEAMVKLSGETAVVNLSSLSLTTKDAMENAIPRLKEMLNENGFSQVDVNVSHQEKKEQDSDTSSNNEHGNSTMPGDDQLSEESSDSDSVARAAGLDEQGLKIVDYYA